MCGERFSSEFSEEEKSAAAAPASFALRDRWTVGYQRYGVVESAYWVDPGSSHEAGFASKAEAEQSVIERSGASVLSRSGPAEGKFFAVPPEIESGDHDVRRAYYDTDHVSTDDLIDFAAAILNNRTAEFERLRVKLAAKTVFAPPVKRTKAEVAEALVAFLTDSTGDAGNRGGFIDLVDGERDGDDSVEFNDYDGDFSRLRDLVKEYRAAPAA